MGLYIGTNEKCARSDVLVYVKFKTLKLVVVSIIDHGVDNLLTQSVIVKTFDNYICYGSHHDDNKYTVIHDYCYYGSDNCILRDYHFEYTFDNDMINFVENKLQYNSGELVSLIDTRDPHDYCVIGMMIELPTLDAIKQHCNYDILLTLYVLFKVILCDDVIKIIFKNSIYLLTYQHYKHEYCEIVYQQSQSFYTVKKKIKIFDCLFKLWLDKHINL